MATPAQVDRLFKDLAIDVSDPVGRTLALNRRYFEKDKNSRKFKVFQRDNWTCVTCRWEAPPEARRLPFPRGFGAYLTLDHVIPKAAGGTNAISNLQTMCRRCNQEKAATLPKPCPRCHLWAVMRGLPICVGCIRALWQAERATSAPSQTATQPPPSSTPAPTCRLPPPEVPGDSACSSSPAP